MKSFKELKPADVQDFLKKVPLKIWIFIGSGIVGLVLFIIFLFIPAWVVRPQVKNQVDGIQNQMNITQNLLRKQPQLIKDKTNLLQVNQEAIKHLYNPGETSLLLGVISRLAQDSKVSVVSSSPKKFETKFPAPFDVSYEGSAYAFTVEGGYHELATFVSKIENNEKILRIQSFNLRAQEKNTDKHLAEMTLTAVSTKAVPPK